MMERAIEGQSWLRAGLVLLVLVAGPSSLSPPICPA
jgi:hypothetical protein